MVFDPKTLKPASKSTEFNKEQPKSPKLILAAAIGKQIDLLKSPSVEGRRWFTLGDKEAAIRIKFANTSLRIVNDEEVAVVPRDQVEAAMLYFKAEAERGAYDAELTGLAEARTARTDKMRTTRAAKRAEKGAEKPVQGTEASKGNQAAPKA